MNKEELIRLQEDENQINQLTQQFFDLFTNTDNRVPDIRKIETLFLPQGLLINNTPGKAAVYDLNSFVEPREKILTDGTLTEFREKEVFHKTDIFGNIAQRSCDYEKSGILDGKAFRGSGKKLIQFVKLNNKWILSSVIWRDNT